MGERPRSGCGSSAMVSKADLETGSDAVATGAGARAVTAGHSGEFGASTP